MEKRKILEAKNISKTFLAPAPITVLQNLSLDVYEEDTIAIMGKSGEGKSTLLHILGTLESPTNGEVSFFGQTPKEKDVYEIRNTHIGFVFQSYNLLEEYTLLENVLMPAKIARKDTSPSSEVYKRALFLLDAVGLSDRKDLPAKKLSGGEKQRTAIARAFCLNPSILFADEPSGNLDNASSALIHNLLISLTKHEKKTLIIVTHDQNLAHLCDKVLLLKDGAIHNERKESLCTS